MMAWLKEYASIYTVSRVQLSQEVRKIAVRRRLHPRASMTFQGHLGTLSFCFPREPNNNNSNNNNIIIILIQSSLVAPTVSSTDINSDFTLIYGLIKQVMEPHWMSQWRKQKQQQQRNDDGEDSWLTVRQLSRVLASAGCLQPCPGFPKSLCKVIIH